MCLIVAIFTLFGLVSTPHWPFSFLPPCDPGDEVKSQRTKEGKSKARGGQRQTERERSGVRGGAKIKSQKVSSESRRTRYPPPRSPGGPTVPLDSSRTF